LSEVEGREKLKLMYIFAGLFLVVVVVVLGISWVYAAFNV